MFDPLPPDIASLLDAEAPGLGRFGRVRYLAEVGSTNDIALALALDGEPEGSVVLADHQRTGRGRRGRDWFSPPGAGLYLSSIVRPRGPASALPLLTLAAGAAVAAAVQKVTSLPVELKWPNDLVIGRPWRKLGGILCETAGAAARIDAVVVGIGVNLRVAAYPPTLAHRATSIEAELGRPIERGPFVVAVLGALAGLVDELHAGHEEAIVRAWRPFGQVGLSGVAVSWLDRDVIRRGRARDIDRDGALVVEAGGRLERIVAGEVRWEGLSGE